MLGSSSDSDPESDGYASRSVETPSSSSSSLGSSSSSVESSGISMGGQFKSCAKFIRVITLGYGNLGWRNLAWFHGQRSRSIIKRCVR